MILYKRGTILFIMFELQRQWSEIQKIRNDIHLSKRYTLDYHWKHGAK